MSEADGLAPRAAALAVVAAALERRTALDEALARPPFSTLEGPDRAHARALAMTVLRRLGPIDAALDACLSKPPPDAARRLLRLGAAQLFYMGAPDFAVVDTTVSLAAADAATRPFKGLINAVLRRLARQGVPADADDHLAPGWLMARWRAAFGDAAAKGIAAAIAEEPATDLSFAANDDGSALAEALQAQRLAGGSWRAGLRGDVADWPGFAEGRWWVQDAAAALPARLLAVKAGESALDLCAAPGGKTLQLAAAGAAVVAVDRSPARLRRLAENLVRTGLCAETVAADAAVWEDARAFDAVLLDAPCTATGAFRRQPEVLWISRPGDIAALAGAQARLLDAAAARVRPGGRLVYSVCSLETEEGEGQVGPFLERHPDFALAPVSPGEGGAPAESVTAEGTLRTLPQHLAGGCDGFFAARFVRAFSAA